MAVTSGLRYRDVDSGDVAATVRYAFGADGGSTGTATLPAENGSAVACLRCRCRPALPLPVWSEALRRYAPPMH
jgi:hypothetical protein